jgi:hypothetical protein
MENLNDFFKQGEDIFYDIYMEYGKFNFYGIPTNESDDIPLIPYEKVIKGKDYEFKLLITETPDIKILNINNGNVNKIREAVSCLNYFGSCYENGIIPLPGVNFLALGMY